MKYDCFLAAGTRAVKEVLGGFGGEQGRRERKFDKVGSCEKNNGKATALYKDYVGLSCFDDEGFRLKCLWRGR